MRDTGNKEEGKVHNHCKKIWGQFQLSEFSVNNYTIGEELNFVIRSRTVTHN